jgi:hypothetical protein
MVIECSLPNLGKPVGDVIFVVVIDLPVAFAVGDQGRRIYVGEQTVQVHTGGFFAKNSDAAKAAAPAWPNVRLLLSRPGPSAAAKRQPFVL